tara:strand:+ start:804 stop:1757 length:954 start_codon:yes stop_codon:yes gene_type:complete
MKKIALVMTGGLRQFARRTEEDPVSCADSWREIADRYDMDVFAFVDNDDFFHDDTQYFPDKYKNRDIEITNSLHCRYHKNINFLNYDESYQMIQTILQDTFKHHLKYYHIQESMDNEATMKTIYNEDMHSIFFNYMPYCKEGKRSYNGRVALLSQFFKLKKGFDLLKEYENKNKFEYDIVIRCRPDCKLYNLVDEIDLTKLDFTNTVACGSCPWHIYDWWAIGNRMIMEEYCAYYDKYMSINLKYSAYILLYMHNGRVFDFSIQNSNIPQKYEEYKGLVRHDVSDSAEFGLTFLIRTLFGYNFNQYGIKYKIEKFYT